MEPIGRVIIAAGIILIVVGILLTAWDRIPLFGKLPGDFHFRRGNFNFYFPLATSILLSVVLTLILWLIRNFGRR
jgi:uncharacterized membrane protein